MRAFTGVLRRCRGSLMLRKKSILDGVRLRKKAAGAVLQASEVMVTKPTILIKSDPALSRRPPNRRVCGFLSLEIGSRCAVPSTVYKFYLYLRVEVSKGI